MNLRAKLTYANVMATIAVFLVLGGGAALAAGALTGKEKKQVGKIASRVFNSRIGGASVNRAAKAADAEKLGGVAPNEFQRKLKTGCTEPHFSISSITPAGDVTCLSPVTVLKVNPVAGEDTPQEIGHGLRVLAVCHDGGQVLLAFQNVGGVLAGQMGWVTGTGTGAATVGQQELASGSGEKDFSYPGTSVQARIVYAVANTVMSINVYARDLTSFCEVRGTVDTAGQN